MLRQAQHEVRIYAGIQTILIQSLSKDGLATGIKNADNRMTNDDK